MNKAMRVIVSTIALCAAFTMCAATTALADEVMTATGNVYVRAQPQNDGEELGVLSTGATVESSGITSEGWNIVTYNGRTAYVYGQYLKATQPATDGTMIAKGDVFIRTQPDASSADLGVLKKGEQIVVKGQEGGWASVTYQGQQAYISAQWLEAAYNGNTAAPQSKTMHANTAVNVRANPDPSADNILGVLSAGDAIQVTGSADGWYSVIYQDRSAYVYGDYLS